MRAEALHPSNARARHPASLSTCAAMSEMWDSVAMSWEANAGFLDEQLALATHALRDAAGIGERDAGLDLAAGPRY